MRIILCDDDTAFTQAFAKRLLTVFKKYGITPEIRVRAHGRGSLARDYMQADGCAFFRH